MSEQELPGSGMATGSEDGDPGDLLDATPLRPDERAVLAALRSGDGVPAAVVEDSPEAERAVQDDTVLPTPPPAAHRDDPLVPEFRAP